MRAVVTTDFGSAPILTEVDTPVAGPGQVRVRVGASSLNGFDLATAAGYMKDFMPHQFPVVLGRDYAGVVDQIGDGVTTLAEGDAVFGMVLTMPLHAGGFAEYLVVPADHQITRIPAGLDHTVAGALPLAGSAALAALEAVKPTAGETVLVIGASGGVGAIAMQVLAAAGAVVIGTAAGEEQAAHVRAHGAHHVVDYREDLGPQVRAIVADGVDVVLHFAGDPLGAAAQARAGGRLASLLAIGPDAFAGTGVSAFPAVATPLPAVLDRLGADVASGALRVPVQRTYPLDQVPAAFGDFAAGTTGKLAITV